MSEPQDKQADQDDQGSASDGAPKAVKRGGSWTNAPHSLRCSKRAAEKLSIRRSNLGLRMANDV